jgi:leucyl aminopeptidase
MAKTAKNFPVLEVRGAASGSVDTDVLGVFQDTGKKAIPPRGAYAKVAEKFRKSDAFAARPGSLQFLRFSGKRSAENALFVGLGTAAELTEERARQAGGNAWAKLVAEKSKTAVVYADSLVDARGIQAEATPLRLVCAFAEGLVLAAYQFTKHKSEPAPKSGPAKISFVTGDKQLKELLGAELDLVQATGEAVNVTRDWSNEPSNIGTPEYFATEARRLSKEYGIKCTVLGEREAAREKMNLFLGVGQGAENEGKIVVMEYTPKGVKNPKTLAFVGKGVTFDSGGISIKPSARMEEMKHDMTGAATVMGGILLAAAWKVPTKIVAIMAFTENMPDGNAIQPGNVLTSRAGKTVEIINTDAEGRLVLADVLDYAHEFKPDAIVDVATLTGAIGIALGKYCSGMFGNDDSLMDAIRRASSAHGERVWEMPVFDEYFDDMRSDTADMKNSCNDSYGGASRGAAFLKQYIKKGMPWAHLDIATLASGVGYLSYIPKRGATGIYVRTLAQLAADF